MTTFESPHHCHLPGCTTVVPRKMLYCKHHWMKVPFAIRKRVWAAYEALPHGSDGECLRVSQEWIDATKEAEKSVLLKD